MSEDAPLSVSIIIPCYNDAEQLDEALATLSGFASMPEVIVVDASPDKGPARQVSESRGVHYIEAAVASRGPQLNEGARASSGDVLVFHHADTALGEAHLEAMQSALRHDAALRCGAFFKDIRSHYPRVAWCAPLVRFYSRRIGVLYGDQSCFFRREHFFEALNGYAEIPLMEDVEMSARMRKHGGLTLLDPPIRTSMRKFRKEGLVWRKIQNVILVLLFRLGVSPHRLYRWYYQKRTE